MNNSENNETKGKFSLPKLQFQQFDGDLKEWQSFFGQFQQISKDVHISPENKCQHLIQAIESGS